LINLLRGKYGRDHYVDAEVQVGKKGQRADFIAVAASWSKPDVHICEVKVSRADFIKDNKWPDYLESCTHFWFVTAPGVIKDRSEIPDAAGWVETSKNGKVLYIRKKAPRRDLRDEAAARVFRQLLHRQFYKKVNGPLGAETPEERRAYWETWLAGEAADKELGYRVSKGVRARIDAAAAQVIAMKQRLEILDPIRRWLEMRNIDPDGVTRYETMNVDRFIAKVAPELISEDGVQEIKFLRKCVREMSTSIAEWNRRTDHLLENVEKKVENRIAAARAGEE
jgi:hypothetical protein